MKLKRTIRYYYLRFLRLKGDPQSLAWGTAIGTFFGITPIIPFHTLINLVVTLLTRTSFLAAALASLIVCNPLTYVPQYWLSTVVGNALTPYSLNWERIKAVLDILMAKPGFMESLRVITDLGYEAIIVLLVGGAVLALPFTIASYVLSLRFFLKIREKRRKNISLTDPDGITTGKEGGR